MSNEIGSEFFDIPVINAKNNVFPAKTKWFLSGRHALEYIVLDSDIKSISMPRWCCDSMIIPFTRHGIKVEFYDKNPNFCLDAVFLIDYFGLDVKKCIGVPKKFKGLIIRDVTHSIFTREYYDADYYFGSLRKWAGFATGGYAWGNWKKKIDISPYFENYVQQRLKAFELKKKFINGEIEDKSYLSIFKEANNLLNSVPVCGAYPADIDSAIHLDISFLREKRRRNAEFLIKALGLQIDLSEDSVPLFVPIFIKNRDLLRRHLIENQVYCPVHWPNYDVDGTELSLVCDQRYNEEDMKRMVRLIKEFESLSR